MASKAYAVRVQELGSMALVVSPWSSAGRSLTVEEWKNLKEWVATNFHIKRGFVREDGRVFIRYNRASRNGECWGTSEAFIASRRITPAGRHTKARVNSIWSRENRDKMRSYKNKWRAAHVITEAERIKRRARDRRLYAENPTKKMGSRSAWKLANPEKYRAAIKRWEARNREKMRACDRARRLANPEKRKAAQRKWLRNNPDKNRAAQSRRFAKKRSLLHFAHDRAAELALHDEAILREFETGTPHEVDHIIPISAGGWHHHLNLQVLPAPFNRSKGGNPFWEKPGYKSWRDVPEYLWPEKLSARYRACAYQHAI